MYSLNEKWIYYKLTKLSSRKNWIGLKKKLLFLFIFISHENLDFFFYKILLKKEINKKKYKNHLIWIENQSKLN